MTGETHYDLEVLAELAEGLLDDATAQRVREHLAICDPCGESLADLAAVRELLAAVPMPAMPLGVSMRIDQALAAEAPDWDRLMQDSPWESAPQPEHERPEPQRPRLRPVPVPASLETGPDSVDPTSADSASTGSGSAGQEEPAPVSLGVVAEDGTVVPVKRKRASRRRWAMPIAVAAAVAVVAGAAGLVNDLLTPGGTQSPYALGQGATSAAPSEKAEATYAVYASGYNYTSRELGGPLQSYFGVGPGSGSTDDESLDTCVKRFSNQLDRTPIAVDKALYNGNEATIMAFWEDKEINAVRVVVVDSNCKTLRREGLATWN